MFIAISGISGSGKNTIMANLVKDKKNFFILTGASATTREIREEDKNYNTYVNMSEEEFKKGIVDDIFIEYENVHGNYYGTLKSAFEKVINDKENDYIKDIDVKGMINLRKYLNGKVKMISIFLDAPDELLEKRLVMRGERAERVKVRLSRGELERKYKDEFDLVVENIELKKTLKIIEDFIEYQRNL